MTFQEYLEKHGPTVKELAEVDVDTREQKAVGAYLLYLASEKESEHADYDFEQGFEMATDVMAYQHMAQDARTAEERAGCPRCGEPIDRNGEYGIICADCWADDVKSGDFALPKQSGG